MADVSPSNTPPPKPAGQKPIGGRAVGIVLASVLVIVVAFSAIFSLGRLGGQSRGSQHLDTPPADERAAREVGRDAGRAADLIRGNEEKAALALNLANMLKAELPECNAKMREQLKGAYYMLHSHNPEYPDALLACDMDNTWRIIPPATSGTEQTSFVAETDAQRNAERHASPGGELSAHERLQLRRQAAFESDSIPVHFSDTAVAPNTAGSKPPLDVAAEAQQPVPPQQTAVNPPVVQTASEEATPLGVELSHYDGPRWPLFQGSYLEGFLVNRLVGDMTGPVKVQISTPKFDNSGQHLLVPKGTIVLGEAQKLGVPGENRLAIVFKRIIMPDGFSILLKHPSPALDQEGVVGLSGRVNSHLWSKISTAVMIGAIEGLSNFTNVGAGGAVVIQGGISQQTGAEAMQIFQSALNRPNSIVVYQGSPIRIPLMWDFPLPEVSGHRVQETVN